MQHGDLETWTRTRLVLILEGLLATVTPRIEHRRLLPDRPVGWDLTWHPMPLKRMSYYAMRYPEVAMEIITFTADDVADEAAEYLNAIPLDYAMCEYRAFPAWISLLPLQTGITQVLDSAPERLDRYGQLGRQVILGGDW
jgi:cell wall assembly regulator SMI1